MRALQAASLALLVWSFPAAAAIPVDVQRVTFLHVADLHASYALDAAGVSPYARIRGYVDRVKQENPFAVFTNGGDDYEKGSVAEQLSAGRTSREAIRAMQFDARVFGNHDFAWDLDEFLRDSRDAHAAVLLSNVDYVGADQVSFGAVDFALLNVGSLRIGVIGLVSDPWDERNETVDRNYHRDLLTSHVQHVAQVRALAATHNGEFDMLVLLSHLGLEEDRRLAAGLNPTDRVAVILGGHTHSLTPTPERVGSTLIIHPGAFAHNLAHLDLEFVRHGQGHWEMRTDTLKIWPVSGALGPISEAVQAEIGALLWVAAPHAQDPLGQLSKHLTERQVATLAAQAACAELGVSAAIFDASTVMSELGGGPISAQDLIDAFKVERSPPGSPGFSSTYTASISGADLERIRLHGGKDLVYAGARELAPARRYRVAVQKRGAFHPSNFLASGITLSESRLAAETWEILEGYVQHRTEACQYADVDEGLPACEVTPLSGARAQR